MLESIWLPPNHPSYLTILSLPLYHPFVYQILSLRHWLQHCCEGYSADTAQMNAWKECYAYDIALATANSAAAT